MIGGNIKGCLLTGQVSLKTGFEAGLRSIKLPVEQLMNRVKKNCVVEVLGVLTDVWKQQYS